MIKQLNEIVLILLETRKLILFIIIVFIFWKLIMVVEVNSVSS